MVPVYSRLSLVMHDASYGALPRTLLFFLRNGTAAVEGDLSPPKTGRPLELLADRPRGFYRATPPSALAWVHSEAGSGGAELAGYRSSSAALALPLRLGIVTARRPSSCGIALSECCSTCALYLQKLPQAALLHLVWKHARAFRDRTFYW